MAADGERGQGAQTGEGEQVTLFGVKCPLGKCPKQGKWLGVKQVWYSERRARQSAYDHLVSTGAHSKLSVDEAACEAFNVEVSQWQVDLQDSDVQEDLEKNNCTVEELAGWQEDAVWFDDLRSAPRRKEALPSLLERLAERQRQSQKEVEHQRCALDAAAAVIVIAIAIAIVTVLLTVGALLNKLFKVALVEAEHLEVSSWTLADLQEA